MITDSVLYPRSHVPAISYIPVEEINPSRPLSYSWGTNKKINESDTDRTKAIKLIQNSMVTVRDLNILKSLLGTGLFTRDQLQRLFWDAKKVNTVTKRLKILVERDILSSSMAHMDKLENLGLVRCSIFGLGPAGCEILAVREQMQSAKKVSYNFQYYVILDNRIIRHHIMTSEIYTQLKTKSNKVRNEMIWLNEMECIIRSIHDETKELVRPDGYAQIWREGFEHTAYLFIETDTRNTDWKKKIESYEKACAHGDWKEKLNAPQFPIVLCVVPNAQAAKRVMSLIKEKARDVVYLVKPWSLLLSENPYTDWYYVQGNNTEERVKILPDNMI